MQTALQLVFDGMPQSEALKQNIRERVEKLEQFSKQIISCRVSVEAGHHHQGKLYHIRIDLQVPDKELVVSRDQHKNHAHEDVLVSLYAMHSRRSHVNLRTMSGNFAAM